LVVGLLQQESHQEWGLALKGLMESEEYSDKLYTMFLAKNKVIRKLWRKTVKVFIRVLITCQVCVYTLKRSSIDKNIDHMTDDDEDDIYIPSKCSRAIPGVSKKSIPYLLGKLSSSSSTFDFYMKVFASANVQ